jgi:hypothetical protein
MPDPNLPLNRPKCPNPLRWVETRADGTHDYVCTDHGRWHLGRRWFGGDALATWRVRAWNG